MWLSIRLKVTKKQGFTISQEDTFLEKPQRGFKLTPKPSLLRAKTRYDVQSSALRVKEIFYFALKRKKMFFQKNKK